MCYRDDVPPLYFDGFHVACLCGDNGNGKSALLDAITWALWGKTRAKSDDDLIHVEEKEMEVEFEFSVGVNRYRILRKRTKGRMKQAGQSILELQIKTPQDFSPITGNTINETQQKIIEILRMDYNTFINSAMLRQGHADEFSTKRPAERKEVLSNILGLSLYDDLEKMAREYRKEREIQEQNYSNNLTRIEQHLENKGQYEEDLKDVQADITVISSDLIEQESSLAALRLSLEAHKSKEKQHEEIKRQIDQANQQLDYFNERVKEHESRIDKYERIISNYDEEAFKIQERLEALTQVEADLKKEREYVEQLSNRIHLLQTSNLQLKTEMQELRKKVDMLSSGEMECPLCGTELGIDGREQIKSNYESEGRAKADTYRANQDEIKEKEEDLKRHKRKIGELESIITTERSQCERRSEALEREYKEATSLNPREIEALTQVRQTIESLLTSLRLNMENSKAILTEIVAMPDIKKECEEAERSYRELRDKDRRLRDRLIEVQTSLRRCVELEAEKENLLKMIRQTDEEKSIYNELATAFGKRGIQALIIESVIPEIEREANQLLGRITDNRMHIKIESQRDTAKGNTIETMEIRISDELGIRNYEMFSGGEAFRVNFALRIALSKLLAKRAGAPLPTLFIDEGFGTQDSTGREKLIEAINSIQDDFDKILVITHIDELKDAFPVRIEVSKTEDGSTFTLN